MHSLTRRCKRMHRCKSSRSTATSCWPRRQRWSRCCARSPTRGVKTHSPRAPGRSVTSAESCTNGWRLWRAISTGWAGPSPAPSTPTTRPWARWSRGFSSVRASSDNSALPVTTCHSRRRSSDGHGSSRRPSSSPSTSTRWQLPLTRPARSSPGACTSGYGDQMADDPDGSPAAWWADPPSTAAVTRSASGGPARRPAPRTVVPPRPPATPTRAPLGDQRGLTATGATLLVLLLSGLGAGVDVVTGTGLRTVFAVAFVVAAALSAATVHHEDLFASVVLVPLVFAVVGGVAGIAEGSNLHPASKLVLAVVNVMVTAAPALMMATLAAAVIAGLRAYAARRRQRPPWRRSAPAR